MSKDITIEGLTPRQYQLVDLLWNCKDIEQVQALIAAMPTKQDRQDCRSLVQLLTWDSIELELGFSKEIKDAAARCISQCM